MGKIVVYTAIFDNYDILKDPKIFNKEIDYICFSNNKRLKSKIWQIIYVPNDNNLNAQFLNRKLKILGPMNELKDYELSLYIDGNIYLTGNTIEFIKKYLSNNLTNFRHPRRSCLYDEIGICLSINKAPQKVLHMQTKNYSGNGMPKNFGLSDNKIILRKHCQQTFDIMTEWWNELLNFPGRDQVSLPYILWKRNQYYNYFDEDIINNKYFSINPHRHENLRRFWRLFKTLKKYESFKSSIDKIEVILKYLFVHKNY